MRTQPSMKRAEAWPRLRELVGAADGQDDDWTVDAQAMADLQRWLLTDGRIHGECYRLGPTNLAFMVTVDPTLGVQIVCDQDAAECGGGPVVTVMHGKECWEVHIRPVDPDEDQDAGRVKVTIGRELTDRRVDVQIAGLSNHSLSNALYDEEADRWEADE